LYNLLVIQNYTAAENSIPSHHAAWPDRRRFVFCRGEGFDEGGVYGKTCVKYCIDAPLVRDQGGKEL
jgi:hypothetical protein